MTTAELVALIGKVQERNKYQSLDDIRKTLATLRKLLGSDIGMKILRALIRSNEPKPAPLYRP